MKQHYNVEDRLYLFFRTVQEYYNVVKIIPLDNEYNELNRIDDYELSSLNIRAMLIRKYIKRSENVHIGSILSILSTELPNHGKQIQELQKKYEKEYEKNLSLIISKDVERNVIESFDDIIYGVYLHADFDRLEKLDKVGPLSGHVITRSFIMAVEKIIYETNEIIFKNIDFKHTNMKNDTKAIVIRDPSIKKTSFQVSDYWENLVSYELSYEEQEKKLLYLDEEDKRVLEITLEFINTLKRKDFALSLLKKLMHKSFKKRFAEHTGLRELIESYGNYGFSADIEYTQNKKVAYVKLFKEVSKGFKVNDDQIVPAIFITLIKRKKTWQIYDIGNPRKPNSIFKRVKLMVKLALIKL